MPAFDVPAFDIPAFDVSDMRLDELDRLLNDPDVPMEASRVWDLIDELSTGARSDPSRRCERPSP